MRQLAVLDRQSSSLPGGCPLQCDAGAWQADPSCAVRADAGRQSALPFNDQGRGRETCEFSEMGDEMGLGKAFVCPSAHKVPRHIHPETGAGMTEHLLLD